MSDTYQYFRGDLNPKQPCYYRVFPDGHYEFYNGGWQLGIQDRWYNRLPQWIVKPIEVSELEVLVVLGAEAVK